MVVDRGRDGVYAVRIFFQKLVDGIRLGVASDGEDFGNFGGW